MSSRFQAITGSHIKVLARMGFKSGTLRVPARRKPCPRQASEPRTRVTKVQEANLLVRRTTTRAAMASFRRSKNWMPMTTTSRQASKECVVHFGWTAAPLKGQALQQLHGTYPQQEAADYFSSCLPREHDMPSDPIEMKFLWNPAPVISSPFKSRVNSFAYASAFRSRRLRSEQRD